MISPALLSRLLDRPWMTRTELWAVHEERFYGKTDTAFGRLPIAIYLGEFLQLRPRDVPCWEFFHTLAAAQAKETFPEHQQAATLFQYLTC